MKKLSSLFLAGAFAFAIAGFTFDEAMDMNTAVGDASSEHCPQHVPEEDQCWQQGDC